MRNPNGFHSIRFIVEQIAMLSQHVPRSGEIGSRQCRGQSHPLFQTLHLEIVNPHRWYYKSCQMYRNDFGTMLQISILAEPIFELSSEGSL